MMTDRQVEAAARRYCELAGLNPDERVRDSGFVPGCDVANYCARWELVVEKILEHERLNMALQASRSSV